MSNFEERRREYLERCEAIIREVGWMVQGVFPAKGDTSPSFAYTVGLHDQGLSELLTFSLPPDVAQMLLNDVGRFLVMSKSLGLPIGGRVEHENWPTPFYLLPARKTEAAQYCTFAMRRSLDAAQVLQVVWPDRTGKFPWEEGALASAKPFQPELYEPPTKGH